METAFGLAAVVLLIAANAFFVAVEFAMVAVDRSRVTLQAETGQKPWPLVSELLKKVSSHLSGAQLGITVSSLVLGQLSKPVIATLISPLLESFVGESVVGGVSILLALILATIIQILFGEMIPKQAAIAEPMRVLSLTARATHIYGIITGPVVRFVNGIANWMVIRMGFEVTEELSSVRSLQELEHVIRSSGEEGTLDPHDVTLLTRSIRFGEKAAADVLVPRVELTSLPLDSTVADLAAMSVGTGYSRFVVTGDDPDDVRGVANVKSVHRIPVGERATTPLSEVMVEAFVVPETLDLETMLANMRRSRQQMAVVLDEHSGIAGIVTTEDIVEEIVGEIADEYDSDDDVMFVQERGAVVLSGSLHPDEVEEICGFRMPDGGFETLAGFALHQMQRIPTEGELFEYEGWRIEIVDMDKRRIESVRLTEIATRVGAMAP